MIPDAATIISAVMSLGTLSVIFLAGKTVARLEHAQDVTNGQLAKLESALAKLSIIDELRTQVVMLQTTTSRCVSDIRELRDAVSESKGYRAAMASIHDKE